MAKVTSKLQVTIPKQLADAYRIRAGSEIRWMAAGEAIRIEPLQASAREALSTEKRLALFDAATKRARRIRRRPAPDGQDRGWKREDLYERGRSR